MPNEQPPALGDYFGALWPSISAYDFRDSLRRVSIPRLVIYPLRDNIPRAGVEEWVRGQPGARIVYIEGSGHFPLYEQRNATLQAIRRFLSEQFPSSPARRDGVPCRRRGSPVQPPTAAQHRNPGARRGIQWRKPTTTR